MRILQLSDHRGQRRVALVDDGRLRLLDGVSTVYELAQTAIRRQQSLSEAVTQTLGLETESYERVREESRLLLPFDHPNPQRLWATGTGLTHVGSATSRNTMHTAEAGETGLTDSMKLFRDGLANGRKVGEQPGSLPEWFYKGNGLSAVPPGGALPLPAYALDGGEEAEIVGLYLNDEAGQPYRLGFALGNEYSDHVLEKQNYLYLAHSKLRGYSFGPELRLGELPAEVRGVSRLWRNGVVLWEREFLSGEAHMSHNLANLEHHHFQYPLFRQPGDAHAHFFGAAVLSFSDGLRVQPGDTFELLAPVFGHSLRNTVESVPPESVRVGLL